MWSDVVCPWCYIGKRRLEKALAEFPHADQVEVVWHSYQLDPGAPAEATERTRDALARRYGGPAAVQQMLDRVEATAAEEGLLFKLSETFHVGTLNAHRLLHLAAEVGGHELQAQLKEAMLDAYFVQARNIGDQAVLSELALAVGLDADRVAEVLAGNEFTNEVHADIAQAQAFGATGVPFFVVDNKYGISGAQPTELFSQALAQAWNESRPQLTTLGDGEAAEACGPDGCAI
ncbi:DsbA family oxidoreductase [Nocardioides sp. Bht2]|uniref:DsbA family oxidoreductase n=1 Tax=Nocardioides sp. Bht2 TaxID=3392297 RepID=UPI0039B46A3E